MLKSLTTRASLQIGVAGKILENGTLKSAAPLTALSSKRFVVTQSDSMEPQPAPAKMEKSLPYLIAHVYLNRLEAIYILEFS